jgi:Uma2 family endonuclease
MSVTLDAPAPTPVYPPHKLWTRSECDALERAGIIDPHRYELIHGELVSKTGKNLPHINALFLLCEWLESVFGKRYVLPEGALELTSRGDPASEPEPDAMVLTRPLPLCSKPVPSEVRLLVEVSDTTLPFDRDVKAALYADAGVTEYWILNVNDRQIIVHREPSKAGYQSVTILGEQMPASPLAAPNTSISAGQLLS